MKVVAARLGRVCPAIVGEDSAVIVAATDDGVLVTMDGDGAAPGYPPRSSEELEIIGTRCTLRFADLTLSLSGAETASIAYERDAIYQASFDACIRHFVECVASGAAVRDGASGQPRNAAPGGGHVHARGAGAGSDAIRRRTLVLAAKSVMAHLFLRWDIG